MYYLLLSFFSMGIFGAIIIILILAGFFIVGASTCALFMELFRELGHPLEFEGMNFLIFVFAVSIALLILSSIGPMCSAIGKSFIVANFIFIIGGIIISFIEGFGKFPNVPSIIIITIISLIVGLKSTENIWDFIVDSPILSILSAIPSCFFIFTYIWLMKEELSPSGSMLTYAKESLVITLIIFGIFTALEIVNLVRNKV